MLLEEVIAELIIKLELRYVTNIYGTIMKEKQRYMYNYKRYYLELYRLHYCSGNYYPLHFRSGVLKTMTITNVPPTNQSTGNKVLLYGTLMI